MDKAIIGACGADCGGCTHYKISCKGCKALAGKPFWAAEHFGDGKCPLFDCSVSKKKLSDCSKCPDLPCKMFADLKDPSYTDEEHQKSITDRVSRLRAMQ